MSMVLAFEPHSYYFGHAIASPGTVYDIDSTSIATMWESVYYDGVKGRWIEREAPTLKSLKRQIRAYHYDYYQGGMS